MRLRPAATAAVFSVVGLLAWLVSTRSGRPTPALAPPPEVSGNGDLRERVAGSSVPCATPMTWRVARVDEEFGLSVSEAEEALQEAMALWATAVGGPVFTFDREKGFPVRLVFDERQETSDERRRLEEEMMEERRAIEATRSALEQMSEEHSRAAEEHRGEARDLQARVRAHNQRVRSWNGRGEPPPDTVMATEAAGRALYEESEALQARAVAIDAERDRLVAERERLQERADSFTARLSELQEAFPGGAVESGVYREAALVNGTHVASVEREIRVYRFDDGADLVRVLAHELGHALGLGHAEGAGALMSARYGREALVTDTGFIAPADVESLRQLCPDVGPP